MKKQGALNIGHWAAVALVLAVLAAAVMPWITGSAEAQSRTNQLTRPCPNSTTPAKVSILATGIIDIRPCTTAGFKGELNVVTSPGFNSATASTSGGNIEMTTGDAGVATAAAATSGDGGNIELATGRGGSSTVAVGNLSGNGGTIELSAGFGGDRTGASGNAGNGGNILIDAGGGGTGSGGASNGSPGEIRIGQTVRSNVEIGTALSVTKIGDVAGTGNGTLLTIDDSAGEITFAGPTVTFAAGAAISSGQSLQFAAGSSGLLLDRTITPAGTTGNRTINKMAGTVNFAAGASAITVTNSTVSVNSFIFTNVRTADATCTFVKSAVPGSGSFVITLNAGCTAETSVAFLVTN